jgi:hypothetical protein
MRTLLSAALVLAATAAPAQEGLPAGGTVSIPTFQGPVFLSIYVANDRDPLVTIASDGRVILGAGYTPDEAARGFWEQISRVYPGMCTAPQSQQR